MKAWFNPTSFGTSAGQSVAASIGHAVYSGATVVKKTVTINDGRAGEYLRLPVASAKRLHWLEVQDLSALVRQHGQDKSQLMHCVNAMRKFMMQRGISVCPALFLCFVVGLTWQSVVESQLC
jgi:hypothetical protein